MANFERTARRTTIALVCILELGALGLGCEVGDRTCTSKSFRELDPGQGCTLKGEILPLQKDQRELGTVQTASVFGEGTKYNQFNLRDEAGVVSIHFVAAEMPLPPTGRRVWVEVAVSEVIAGPKVLVAKNWDFLDRSGS